MVSAQLGTEFDHFLQNLNRAMYTSTLPNTNTRLNAGHFGPNQAFFNQFAVPRANGTRAKRLLDLSGEQGVQSLQVESQTYQTPLSCCCRQPAQRKLTKAHNLLDDTYDGFDSAFAQSVDCLANFCLQFVSHFDLGANIFVRRLRQSVKPFLPTLVTRFTPRGDIRFNTSTIHLCDVLFAEVS